ncbi:MAG: hypothetical protein P1P86_14620 [Bacteroidales bacterium]|nr:hypothetical protein [Bacteroidales bacterium]
MNKIYVKYGGGTEFAGTYIEQVAGLKIYFGHQSVGNNIISGITQWEDETGVQLSKVESKDPALNVEISLVHFKVGSNSDPHSKIDDFVSLVAQIPDEGNPVAFFKLCYVDITPDTDVDKVYGYYKEKMLYLIEMYPNIRFMACTVPYMGLQKGMKAIAKRMLGRQSTGHLGNIKREEFNKNLLNDFQGVIPVFDLGGIESTLPDGSKATYNFKGSDYPYMPDIYTYDLGHLTELGSKTLSYNLLAFLAEEFK